MIRALPARLMRAGYLMLLSLSALGVLTLATLDRVEMSRPSDPSTQRLSSVGHN